MVLWCLHCSPGLKASPSWPTVWLLHMPAVQTINVAIASPTSGPGPLATAGGGATIDAIGCPGAVASLRITALQLRLLKAVLWNVTAQAAPADRSIKVSVGATADVAFGLRYIAMPAEPVRQLVGTVSVRSIGRAALQVAQLLLDVSPLGASSLGRGPLVTWTALCPGGSSRGSVTAMTSNTSTSCSFTGLVPSSLMGAAAIVARLQLADGSEAASPAAMFDFSQTPTHVVSRGRCAVVADHFLQGPGLLQPSRTSRPAAAAAAMQVCNSQSVSYVVTLGPFTKAQCGQPLGVGSATGWLAGAS